MCRNPQLANSVKAMAGVVREIIRSSRIRCLRGIFVDGPRYTQHTKKNSSRWVSGIKGSWLFDFAGYATEGPDTAREGDGNNRSRWRLTFIVMNVQSSPHELVNEALLHDFRQDVPMTTVKYPQESAFWVTFRNTCEYLYQS